MQEQGEPALSPAGVYRARVYEKFIKREYLLFLVAHPTYALELFFYYKPAALVSLVFEMIGAIHLGADLLALVSLVLALTLVAFAPGFGLSSYAEIGISFSLIWLSSLLPVFWAYPAPYVIEDSLMGTFLLLAAVLSLAGVLVLRAIVHLRDLRRNIEAQSPAETVAS